ncbi:MAG: iron-containing alcohol dehydrogenase [Acidimicrobiales bacterium]
MSGAGSVIVDQLTGLRDLVGRAPASESLRPIGLREVVRGSGAVRTLPDVLARCGVAPGSTVAVLCDRTPKLYGDEDLMDVVLSVLGSAFATRLVRVESGVPGGQVVAEETTVATAIDGVRRGEPDGLVSVGSGTVVDIAKVVARELSLTHVVVQSAASVNGFADDQSVLLVNGVKRTTPSRWPEVVVVDPEVVSRAPVAMARSGLGDQLSMFTASADWYLANAIGYDATYSPTLVSLMRGDIDELLAVSANLGDGEPRSVDVLARCLTLGGLAMGVAGRTAPSSGTEHAISHLLEMHADAVGTPSASHGSQVGSASVLAALVWQRVRTRLASDGARTMESPVAPRERVFQAFTRLDDSGVMAQECWSAYERKSSWIRGHLDQINRLLGGWSSHEVVLDQLLAPAADISVVLRGAGAPVAFRQLEPAPDPHVVSWAVTNCHLMRDRFGVVDVAECIGAWGPEDIAAVLAELEGLAR